MGGAGCAGGSGAPAGAAPWCGAGGDANSGRSSSGSGLMREIRACGAPSAAAQSTINVEPRPGGSNRVAWCAGSSRATSTRATATRASSTRAGSTTRTTCKRAGRLRVPSTACGPNAAGSGAWPASTSSDARAESSRLTRGRWPRGALNASPSFRPSPCIPVPSCGPAVAADGIAAEYVGDDGTAAVGAVAYGPLAGNRSTGGNRIMPGTRPDGGSANFDSHAKRCAGDGRPALDAGHVTADQGAPVCRCPSCLAGGSDSPDQSAPYAPRGGAAVGVACSIAAASSPWWSPESSRVRESSAASRASAVSNAAAARGKSGGSGARLEPTGSALRRSTSGDFSSAPGRVARAGCRRVTPLQACASSSCHGRSAGAATIESAEPGCERTDVTAPWGWLSLHPSADQASTAQTTPTAVLAAGQAARFALCAASIRFA